MNVLLVSQAYPPYAIVGAQRARRVADTMRARGHRVFVITERLEGERPELRIDEPGLQVYTVPLKPQYRIRVVRAIQRLKPGRTDDISGESGTQSTSPVDRGMGLLRRAALSILWLPDDELRFVAPALEVARMLMSQHKIDVVYTTSPPHSSHLVGLRLRTSSEIRWVAEFRDPWTDQRNPERVAHWFGPVEVVHRWLELRCLKAADHVVAVTNSARDRLASKLPEKDRGKVVVALNGIECLHPRQPQAHAHTFRIVHAGTFYHDRDPRPFLHALAALCRARGLTQADLRVDLVGRCRIFDGISVEGEVESSELAEIVHFHDWMEPADAQAMMRSADLLLLLACSQPLQVPNKLFDYLGARVPVLAIVDSGGESERMLSSVGGQFIVPVAQGETVSEEAILEALAAAIDARQAEPETDEELLQEWSSAVQMERLATAIGA